MKEGWLKWDTCGILIMHKITNKYEDNDHCDMCGKKGAYDMAVVFICDDCLAIYLEQQKTNVEP